MPTESRQLVIHHDDLGGSHSANKAFVDLVDLGVVTCGSVMVPGPWFAEVVGIAHARPNLDIGVHLTLTSEFADYRWRPLTDGDSLVDATGHLWSDLVDARGASPADVYAELRKQIQVALDAGIDVTHLDSHMGTVWQPEFIDIYMTLGEEFRLPIVVTDDLDQLSEPHPNSQRVYECLRNRRNPAFRRFLTTPFGNLAPAEEDYRDILAMAEPGLNWCGFHFAAPGDIELMTEDADTRIAEYRFFRSGDARAIFDSEGFQLVGMREYRDRMRA